MARGGYQIIDLKGVSLTSGSEASVKGIGQSAKNAYNKPTMVCGLVVGDVVYPDFYLPFVEAESSYTGTVVINGDTIEIVIDDDDNITVTVTSPES